MHERGGPVFLAPVDADPLPDEKTQDVVLTAGRRQHAQGHAAGVLTHDIRDDHIHTRSTICMRNDIQASHTCMMKNIQRVMKNMDRIHYENTYTYKYLTINTPKTLLTHATNPAELC